MLPVINVNTKFEYTIHHTNQVIMAQGYTVGQESALLASMELSDLTTEKGIQKVQTSIAQLCQECILSKDINVRSWPNYEIEFFLLQLRIHSTGDVIDSKFICDNEIESTGKECNNTIELKLDLNQFYIKEYKKFSTVFKLNEEYTLHLKQILPLSLKYSDGDTAVIKSCLDYLVYEKGEESIVYYFKDVDEEGIDKFVKESISPRVMNNILKEFFNSSPTIYHVIDIPCSACGKVHTIESKSATSLFQ